MSAVLTASLSAPAAVPVPIGEMLAIVREYIDAARYDAAERLLGHILAASPQHGESLHLKGYIAFKRNRSEEAAVLMEQGLAAGAAAPRQLCNLAEVYRLLGRLDEGLALVRRAQALAPADAVGHFNEAMLRYERLEPDACIRAARRAIALKPDMPEAHMRLGQTLLLTGEFAEGWEEYEWRYQIAGAQPLMPKTDKPQWDGRTLGAEERLLLIADQGFGDVIMFARYLPWAFARAASVSVATSGEMRALLERHYPGASYFSRWDECPAFAAYCPFSGLSRLAGTRLDSVPPPAPLWAPPAEKRAEWQARLDALVPAGLRRIAIAWAGRPTHNNDRNRSITLDVLAPLGALPGVALLAVQKGPAAAQAAEWRGAAPLISLDAEIADFDDTAAILAATDLLVCVDTSLGHLAGALGLPAWVLLPYAPDWRWLMGRLDTPWYPTLRLWRQPGPRGWAPLIAAVADELAASFAYAPMISG
ncbi:MAG: tetratricopeptide repeat protein [Alphaproteobacteria bacterium]|nr:tetratricopeptide repeat protein [Alphaproteobacteria bacterium]